MSSILYCSTTAFKVMSIDSCMISLSTRDQMMKLWPLVMAVQTEMIIGSISTSSLPYHSIFTFSTWHMHRQYSYRHIARSYCGSKVTTMSITKCIIVYELDELVTQYIQCYGSYWYTTHNWASIYFCVLACMHGFRIWIIVYHHHVKL